MTLSRSRSRRLRRNRVGSGATGASATNDWPSEARIRHLELIQSVVSRLATNSFLTKGWALTVAGAVYGFSASHLNPWIAAVGFMPTLGFWWLDAYFLRQERLFRCLYNDARQPATPVVLFSMQIGIYKSNPIARWPRVLFSITLLIFYGILTLTGAILLGAGVARHTTHAHLDRTSSAVSSRTVSEIRGLSGHISPIWSFCQRGTK
jgi:hypothetical protein